MVTDALLDATAPRLRWCRPTVTRRTDVVFCEGLSGRHPDLGLVFPLSRLQPSGLGATGSRDFIVGAIQGVRVLVADLTLIPKSLTRLQPRWVRAPCAGFIANVLN